MAIKNDKEKFKTEMVPTKIISDNKIINLLMLSASFVLPFEENFLNIKTQ